MICKKCLIDRPESEFYKYSGKQSLMGECKICYGIRQKKWKDENQDKRSAINKRYNEKNKDKQRQYYLDNKERLNAQNKANYYENKEEFLEKQKIYVKNNRDKINERQRIKRLTNRKTIVDRYMEEALRKAVKKIRPSRPFFELVGYSLDDLESHFIMICKDEYNAYVNGSNEYELDHIIPRRAFNYTNKKDLECIKCWNYKNLRIIKSQYNMSKGGKVDFDLIKKHNIEQLLPEAI